MPCAREKVPYKFLIDYIPRETTTMLLRNLYSVLLWSKDPLDLEGSTTPGLEASHRRHRYGLLQCVGYFPPTITEHFRSQGLLGLMVRGDTAHHSVEGMVLGAIQSEREREMNPRAQTASYFPPVLFRLGTPFIRWDQV